MTRLQKGHLYKAYGAWHVRYRENVWQEDGTTKRIQVSKRIASLAECPRKGDARLLAEEILHKVNTDRTSPSSTMPLVRFVENIYLPHAKTQRRASTFNGYGHVWEKHLKPRIADVRVRDFRTWDGERLLQEIATESSLSRATLKQIKSLLSAIFKHAKRCGAINGVNPMQDVSIPGNAKGPGETFAYSLEEIQRMLTLLPEPIATVIATAAFTGLRKGELRGLTWENYTGKEIRVTQSLWETHVSGPKTRSSKAPVPVIGQLAAMLERHRLACGNPASGWIFAATNGSPLHLDNLVRRVILPVLGKAGVKWRGWHAFRRGLASNLYRLGISDKTIQAILRHANLAITMNHYVMSAPADTVEAMGKLETVCNERAMGTLAGSSVRIVN
ncbi:MAG TPA: tyrosine-type recombinase/integrase [Terriglobales bacterium]|jgi:integrase|nr:tyrosine-type recombinase/integrase [Terriglobales bacterium]